MSTISNEQLTPEQREIAREAYKAGLIDGARVYGYTQPKHADLMVKNTFPDPVVYPRDSRGREWKWQDGKPFRREWKYQGNWEAFDSYCYDAEYFAECFPIWTELQRGNQ